MCSACRASTPRIDLTILDVHLKWPRLAPRRPIFGTVYTCSAGQCQVRHTCLAPTDTAAALACVLMVAEGTATPARPTRVEVEQGEVWAVPEVRAAAWAACVEFVFCHRLGVSSAIERFHAGRLPPEHLEQVNIDHTLIDLPLVGAGAPPHGRLPCQAGQAVLWRGRPMVIVRIDDTQAILETADGARRVITTRILLREWRAGRLVFGVDPQRGPSPVPSILPPRTSAGGRGSRAAKRPRRFPPRPRGDVVLLYLVGKHVRAAMTDPQRRPLASIAREVLDELHRLVVAAERPRSTPSVSAVYARVRRAAEKLGRAERMRGQ